MTRTTQLASLLAALLIACSGQQAAGPDAGADVGADAGVDAGDPVPDSPALLEVYSLDIWGQPLPADATLEVINVADELPVPVTAFPVGLVGLDRAGVYRIVLTAPEHEQLEVVVDFTGGADGALTINRATDGHGASLSHDERVFAPEQPAKNVHTLYLGLKHKWFSSQGRPARRGNKVSLLMDGEQAWSTVHADVTAATDSISLSTWWWESGFELIRDEATHATSTESDRRANTILSVLDASPATKRVLVGQFINQDGLLASFSVDTPLTDRGAAANDSFEYMGQANVTSGVFDFTPDSFSFVDRVQAVRSEVSGRSFDAEQPIASVLKTRRIDLDNWPIDVEIQHASWHQKFIVVDSDVAFIGGMNLRRVDWDTSEHLVFDPRRMLVDSSSSARAAVVSGDELPDTGPRKDYMTRIEGPSAQDAADVFSKRWELARSASVEYSANSSSFAINRDIDPRAGGVQAQVTATMPAPLWEHAIGESWINAVNNATDYIYIEDQYFRAPMLFDAIVARMRAMPALKLIVVTKPVDEWTDPGCAWTHRAHARFTSEFPTRYTMLQLRAFATQVTWGVDETDAHFPNMDVHSKIIIVDDTFLSVGSANKNNRGMVYEGELNVAVVDRTWVTEQRRRIITNILPEGSTVGDDSAAWNLQLINAATNNQVVYDAWDAEGMDISLDGDPLPAMYTPHGFVYPLSFRTVSDCLIEDVGPDMV